MQNYDFFVAGRWRNKDNVQLVLSAIRESGRIAYCFIENDYQGEKVEFLANKDPNVFMGQLESLAQDDPLMHKIFETDMNAERAAENFILVLPAGIAGHVEAGAAYGMGKKCYAVGKLEKSETLYCIFEQVFPDLIALKEWLANSTVA